MSYLIMIRHSNPEIIPHKPSNTWHLSAEGIQRSRQLASKLGEYSPSIVITSDEPKAIETGGIIAEFFRIECQQFPGLHEQERSGESFTTPEDFRGKIRRLFDRPDEIIFGSENGRKAKGRFSNAVDTVIGQFPGQDMAIVTHGTVLSLWIEAVTGRSAYDFWQTLGLPSAVTLTYPEMEIVAEIHI